MEILGLEVHDASALLAAGRAVECIAKCRAVLLRSPKEAAVAHLLGLALKDTGAVAEGEGWLRASVEWEPRRADFRANLANLYADQGRLGEAEAAYREALELEPTHRAGRLGLASLLLDLGRFEAARLECRWLTSADATDAAAWLMLGLALNGLGRPLRAETAYRRAIELDPRDALAPTNLGGLLNQSNRGAEALEQLDRASALGASGYALAFNRGRALLSLNRIEDAEREFAQAVAFDPSSAEAHANLSRLRYMLGDAQFARALAGASAADRDNVGLQSLFALLMWRSGNLESAESLSRDLLARKGPIPQVQATLAGVLHEAGMGRDAEKLALEAAAALPEDSDTIETLVNIMLTLGHAADALPFIHSFRRRFPFDQGWLAYEATAERALGGSLHRELYDYERFVRVYDLETPSGWSSSRAFHADLARALALRHGFAHHPLDQTLRNGTQTASSLLTADEPSIQAIFKSFEGAIGRFQQEVGRDPRHPLTARNTGSAAITSAWSVRLRKQGFHVNHFHPEGWLSSAYYVEVPEESRSDVLKAGWLKFGEPRFPVPGLTAERYIQPKPGRLVLFPSYMWHGTNAIQGDAPRLSIAFDVTPTEARLPTQ